MIRKPLKSELGVIADLYTRDREFMNFDKKSCMQNLHKHLIQNDFFEIYVDHKISAGLIGKISHQVFNDLRYLMQIAFYIDTTPENSFRIIKDMFTHFELFAIKNRVDIIQVTSHPGDSRQGLVKVLTRLKYQQLGYMAKKDLR